jgi:FkbM family methyltransferase
MADKIKEPKRIDDVEKSKLDVVYCIPLEQRDAQMRENIARIRPRIQPGPITHEPIAIVGFGPSLNDTWEEIRKFKYIFTGSGSHKFLVDRDIIPTHHAEVDPREHKIDLMGTPQVGTEYLIASCCHPKLLDHLEGYNTKLWHIHSGDNAQMLPTVFPRGEYILTGGSNVGLRSMVLARFLGFVNMHVFGMDCSMSNEGKSHAEFHPKGSKGYYLTDYEGVEYKVTQPLVEYARQFFHELKQMPEVNITLYGKGLLQHMAEKKLEKPNQLKKPKKEIAYINPKVITEEYLKLNKTLHEQNPNYGVSGAKRADVVIKLSESMNTKNILDYGCGKGMLAKKLPFPIWEYDPAIPGKDAAPRPAELVICTDVLEHIEPDLLDNVLQDIARCTLQTAYVIIATFPAQKTLPDGRNAHLIQQGADWWRARLEKFFEVAKIIESKDKELHIVLAPKLPEKSMVSTKTDLTKVTFNNTELVYATPNDATRWRANSMFTKEPITIEWLQKLTANDVLYDVGANIGIYSIFAAKIAGAKVYAFEPESQNYSILNRNIVLNGVQDLVNAYCIALSDETKITQLHLSSFDYGGSCHSVDDKVDFKHEPMTPKYSQGCVSNRIDALIAFGLPAPTHIKLDVDGFEPKVIAGGRGALRNVRSLIIEINQNLEDHQQLIKFLADNGYKFDPAQVAAAERQSGAFKGVAEYVFTRD